MRAARSLFVALASRIRRKRANGWVPGISYRTWRWADPGRHKFALHIQRC